MRKKPLKYIKLLTPNIPRNLINYWQGYKSSGEREHVSRLLSKQNAKNLCHLWAYKSSCPWSGEVTSHSGRFRRLSIRVFSNIQKLVPIGSPNLGHRCCRVRHATRKDNTPVEKSIIVKAKPWVSIWSWQCCWSFYGNETEHSIS